MKEQDSRLDNRNLSISSGKKPMRGYFSLAIPRSLDVDIVRNAAIKYASLLSGQRFIQRLVLDSNLSMKFQEFLAKHSLSSHTWVYARNPAD